MNVTRWVTKTFSCLGIEETVYSMGSVLTQSSAEQTDGAGTVIGGTRVQVNARIEDPHSSRSLSV